MKNFVSTRSFSFGMGTFLFSYLVLSLFILSISAEDIFFLSIDCGSSDSYKDENSIAWTGDDNYVKTGKSHSVQSAKYSVSRVMDTMRVFTFPSKNCYHIDSVKQGQRVLVRASFLYGNYDNKSSPPIFSLYIDGAYWETVRTSMWEVVYHEVVYVLKKDSISVCLWTYPGTNDPFISALEVRGLALYRYVYRNDDEDYPLFLWKRFAFGSNQTVRYPSDPYDRIWTDRDVNYESLIPVSNNNATLTYYVGYGDGPPPAVLKHAVTCAAPPNYMAISIGESFPFNRPAYYIAYFSEVTQLKPNQNRSFRIQIDNGRYSQPILPPYGAYKEQFGYNITFSEKSKIYISPTGDSTLPPLINALEIFSVGKALINGTDDKDVEGLASLQKAFPVLQQWTGDPCLPDLHTWEWVYCDYYNYKPRPRVIELHLGGYGLSGVIPDFSSMDVLYGVDLSHNSLKGPVPDFFTRLRKLRTLDVSYNQLNGSVPASLAYIIDERGNPDLCIEGISCRASCSCRKMNKKTVTVFFGSIIPIIITYIWF
ncbi:hypothetical protein ABFS82_14G248900 [Erythranthe guttata]|nr:PREDICTED: probable LRR receptor-like serine/threonine-protein kinase At1g05700 isoform X2 [Erythranthe guttata]|eukprot:XP_012838666.1 PREDICTED: probable LRR receptor-like serine/threonine-protein kinase At1g05700 isoform X2 [Erythranthe guttata]